MLEVVTSSGGSQLSNLFEHCVLGLTPHKCNPNRAALDVAHNGDCQWSIGSGGVTTSRLTYGDRVVIVRHTGLAVGFKCFGIPHMPPVILLLPEISNLTAGQTAELKMPLSWQIPLTLGGEATVRIDNYLKIIRVLVRGIWRDFPDVNRCFLWHGPGLPYGLGMYKPQRHPNGTDLGAEG